jgi:hypothetical protein
MKKTLILEIPDDVFQALKEEAARTGKPLERIALERITLQASQRRGSAEALQPFFGAWSMSPDERADIERMIEEERHLEDNQD